MKIRLPGFAHLLIALILLDCFLVINGCAGKGQYNPNTGLYDRDANASEVVVAAETLRASALEVFALIMETERTHEAELKKIDPAIHTFANEVRTNGAGWLNAMTDAKTAYQANRTPSNLSALNASLAAVNIAVARANKYLLPNAGVNK